MYLLVGENKIFLKVLIKKSIIRLEIKLLLFIKGYLSYVIFVVI